MRVDCRQVGSELRSNAFMVLDVGHLEGVGYVNLFTPLRSPSFSMNGRFLRSEIYSYCPLSIATVFVVPI